MPHCIIQNWVGGWANRSRRIKWHFKYRELSMLASHPARDVNWNVANSLLVFTVSNGKQKCRKFCAKHWLHFVFLHYCDVKMGTMVSHITSLTIVYWTIYSDADQRKHQRSASLTFVRGIHRGPLNFPHKWLVTRTVFPVDHVIMSPSHQLETSLLYIHVHQIRVGYSSIKHYGNVIAPHST